MCVTVCDGLIWGVGEDLMGCSSPGCDGTGLDGVHFMHLHSVHIYTPSVEIYIYVHLLLIC